MNLPARCLPHVTAVGALLLASCSSTTTGARSDGTLVVEHRGWRDAVTETWLIEGAVRGGAIKAEELNMVSRTYLGPLGFRTEPLEPARKLQGVVDWSDSAQVMINIRQRGVSRWTELPINGRHAVGVAPEPEELAAREGYVDRLSWKRPGTWVGLGGGNEEGGNSENANLPPEPSPGPTTVSLPAQTAPPAPPSPRFTPASAPPSQPRRAPGQTFTLPPGATPPPGAVLVDQPVAPQAEPKRGWTRFLWPF